MPRNNRDDAATAICPECGAELDAAGDCPVCGYEADDEERKRGPVETRVAPFMFEIDVAEMQRRRLAGEETRAAGGAAVEDDTLPISISSEYPVERYDWYEGSRYNEVLVHTPAAVDMTRAAEGMPFLDSHMAHDGRRQMGRVMNVRVDGGQLKGDVKFSRRTEAQELRRDMLDGIKREISVGYIPDHNNLEKVQRDGDEIPTVRINRWMPYEASCVPIPADPSVGVGRSAASAAGRRDALLHIVNVRDNPPAANAAKHGEPMPKPDDTAANTDVRVGESADNQKAMREIAALADAHAMQDKLPKWIREGTSPAAAQQEIISELEARIKKGPTFSPAVTLSEKEEREYSFARAILGAADGRQDTFESEVSQTIEKKLGHLSSNGGNGTRVYIPTHLRMFPDGDKRSGLDSGTSGKGTELKFTVPGTFIEMLRNKARVLQLGATMLSGLEGNVTFPKQTAAGTATWQGENTGTDVPASALTLGVVTLAAKTLMSTTTFSRQLLRQAVIDVENMVRNDLANIHALAIDQAAINGGGGLAPNGILGNTSVGIVAMGPNGLVPDYAAMVRLEAAVEAANGDIGSRGYLTTPGIKGTLKTTAMFASSNGVPVWLGGDEGEVNGYKAFSSNQVPSNLSKGTSTTIASAILYGAWANFLIGEWGALELIVDPYTMAKQGMLQITSFQMIDMALRYPESFAVTKDALKGAGF